MATWKKIITAADDADYKNNAISLAQLDAGLDGESGYAANKILAVNGAGNAIEWTTPTSGDLTEITVGEGIGGSDLTGPVPDITLALSELTTSTADGDGDFFAVVDTADAQKKLTKANIALSGFDNDSSWTDDTAADAAQATANAALPKAGGQITGNITCSGSETFDGKDVSTLGTAAEGAAAAITLLAQLDGDDTTYIGDNGNDTNISIRGNLTVTGTTTTVNTTELAIADNKIVLNSDETGAPSADAGITIERGSSVDSQLFWDESAASFTMTTTGDYYSDSSTETSLTNNITPIYVGANAPAQAPHQGSLWYDTDDDTLYVATVSTSIANP